MGMDKQYIEPWYHSFVMYKCGDRLLTMSSSPVAQCVAQRAPMQQQYVWWLVRAPCSS